MSIWWFFLTLLILSPILWTRSHVFRFYVKWVYFVIFTCLVTPLLIVPYLAFRPRDVRNVWPIKFMWSRMFNLPFCIDYEIRGKEHLKSEKPYVLVCNHQSSLDVIGMMMIYPDRCSSLAKKELLYTGTFGLGAWICGLVFVDRVHKDKARETMNKTAQIMHDRSIKLFIFPEGTRSLDRGFKPFKKGAFHLAQQAKVPIVPVVFSSYTAFYDIKRKILEPGKVIIQVLPPIPTEDLTHDDINDLLEKTQSQMLESYNAISDEVLASSPPLESFI